MYTILASKSKLCKSLRLYAQCAHTCMQSYAHLPQFVKSLVEGVSTRPQVCCFKRRNNFDPASVDMKIWHTRFETLSNLAIMSGRQLKASSSNTLKLRSESKRQILEFAQRSAAGFVSESSLPRVLRCYCFSFVFYLRLLRGHSGGWGCCYCHSTLKKWGKDWRGLPGVGWGQNGGPF